MPELATDSDAQVQLSARSWAQVALLLTAGPLARTMAQLKLAHDLTTRLLECYWVTYLSGADSVVRTADLTAVMSVVL